MTATATPTSTGQAVTGRPGPRPRSRRPAGRAVLVVPAALAMLAGLDAGLDLLGLWAPVTADRLADSHGLLMVLGFVGSLVALERAVALRHPIGYGAPVGLSLGALMQLSAATADAGAVVLLAGAGAFVAVYVPLWRRQRDDAILVETMGAVLAVGAVVLWTGGVDVPRLLPWLAGFLVLTIVGERLELARLAMPPRAGTVLVAATAAYCVAIGSSLLWPRVGTPLLGLALAVLVGWLVTYDVAKRTIRSTGVARFMGWSMLFGQAWLGVAAAVWLVGGVPDGSAYDAVVHSVFLGFTMSMVMAHASVILPAVTRIRFDHHPVMWAPMLLLQASLVARVWLGDGLGLDLAWQLGGAANVVAVLGFFATVVWSVAKGTRS